MNRIREFRVAHGWSLQKLAEASGTSKSQIDKLEKGDRRLTVDWMVRLAKPLKCDPRDLMAAEGEYIRAVTFGGGKAGKIPTSDSMIPVRGLRYSKNKLRGKNKRDMVFSNVSIDHVPRPYYLAHAKDAYAIYVADDAMIPMYRPRQLLFVNPYKLPVAGAGVVITGKNGAVTIREFVRAQAKSVVVRAYRPRGRDFTIPQKFIAGLHAVAGTVEG